MNARVAAKEGAAPEIQREAAERQAIFRVFHRRFRDISSHAPYNDNDDPSHSRGPSFRPCRRCDGGGRPSVRAVESMCRDDTEGDVTGPPRGGSCTYLGVPYAAPPVGESSMEAAATAWPRGAQAT